MVSFFLFYKKIQSDILYLGEIEKKMMDDEGLIIRLKLIGKETYERARIVSREGKKCYKNVFAKHFLFYVIQWCNIAIILFRRRNSLSSYM